MKKDQRISESWKKNASPWIRAIEGSEIESRVSVTNEAIVNTVLSEKPKNALDIGCGEGWLVRRLEENEISSLGVDIVPGLIEQARSKNKGRFKLLSYEDLSLYNLKETFDVLVCNFSLIGKESVEQVFRQAYNLLNISGVFIIQTLHPIHGGGDKKYEDGWRESTWSGFNEGFTDPPPWYFRTIDSWKNLFIQNKFRIKSTIEPINLKTNIPASIIFIGEKI